MGIGWPADKPFASTVSPRSSDAAWIRAMPTFAQLFTDETARLGDFRLLAQVAREGRLDKSQQALVADILDGKIRRRRGKPVDVVAVASGSNLTFESWKGFPSGSLHASLAHANRNFHYSQAC